MPIYFVHMPEEQEKETNLNMLLNSLEKMYEVITFNVVGITAQDPRVDPLLRDLAMHVDECEPVQPVQTVEAITDVPLPTPETVETEIPANKKICKECGNPFEPRQRNSSYCSKTCASRAYQRKWQGRKKGNANEERNGDGVRRGSLVKH